MATISNAEAVWEGNLEEGKGTMKVGSGGIEGNFTRASRFVDGAGNGLTNPEELVGAAQAGCFSMFLGAQLAKAGFPANRIHTTAQVTMEAGPTITKIELTTDVDAPGVDNDKFQELVKFSKENCPVSKALASVDVSVNASLK